VKKGGKLEDTIGRKCLCNALMSNIGLGQTQKCGSLELPLVTAGDDLIELRRFLKPGRTSYTAREVVESLMDNGAKLERPSPVESFLAT
jgi:nitronate monooxygenase